MNFTFSDKVTASGLLCRVRIGLPTAIIILSRRHLIGSVRTPLFQSKMGLLSFSCSDFAIFARLEDFYSPMSLLTFRIPYSTRWGEQLFLNYQTDAGHDEMLKLHTRDGQVWEGDLSLPASVRWIDYAYQVVDSGRGTLRTETDAMRRVMLRRRKSLFLSDTWTERGIPSEFQSKAFTQTLFGSPVRQRTKKRQKGRCMLVLRALPAPQGYRWAVVGSSFSLGQWHPERAHKLQPCATYEYSIPLAQTDLQKPTFYKYILQSEEDPAKVVWEEGENRTLPAVELSEDTTFIHNDASPRIDGLLWRGAGVVVPVFSLRSERSQGIGDFAALKSFVGWAASCGMRAVQILPVNDTTATHTWRDSYPYNPISVFALHPIYLDMAEWSDSKAFKAVQARAEKWNREAEVAFEEVLQMKQEFLRNFFEEEGQRIMRSADFKAFCTDNKDWLIDYAHYCFLRDTFLTPDFRLWPAPYKYMSAHKAETHQAEAFWSFVQYLLHTQLLRAHEFARQNRVLLKGDIPIGVSPDGVDAWIHPELYHFDGQAGAPPDFFSRDGQNWGFPTYNWEEMAKTDYAWWRKRLTVMSRYLDAYRLDHVLGFFRIWEIPSGQISGRLGRFRPALPLSDDEIRQSGFTQPPAHYARPRLSERRLAELTEQTECATFARYFQKEGGYYTLRPEVATQRQIVRLVGEEKVRVALCEVVTEVLFIPDSEKPNHFHPAVAAMDTQVFSTLPPDQQAAFRALHFDFFHIRHNDFWQQAALRKLSSVTRYAEAEWMLPCVEDLGFVPACVQPVLNHLHLLSLEIQSMPKQQGCRFGQPEAYPYLSVATIATHDMAPFRLWWATDQEGRSAYWHDILHSQGTPPEEATPEICQAVVQQHLHAGSMLCLISLQDWLATSSSLRRPDASAEQINNPANPDQHWVYRMHLTVEQLYKAVDFNERLRVWIQQSGR